jgi:raffinose/stachyose/melibiose transport system substrate-binding protein
LPLITQASNNPQLALNLDRLTEKGLSWDSKPVTEAFALMQRLVDAKVFETGPTSVQQTESVALFSTGKAAMMFYGSFIVPPLLTSASKSFNKLYKVGMQPAWTAGAKHWAGNQCGAGWAINAHSSKTQAAATFLKWLYEPTRYATIMNNSSSMAATQSAALKGTNPRVREMASWIQDNGCCHILFGVGSFTAASNTAAAVIDGKLSPASAAAKMQSTVLQARKV